MAIPDGSSAVLGFSVKVGSESGGSEDILATLPNAEDDDANSARLEQLFFENDEERAALVARARRSVPPPGLTLGA